MTTLKATMRELVPRKEMMELDNGAAGDSIGTTVLWSPFPNIPLCGGDSSDRATVVDVRSNCAAADGSSSGSVASAFPFSQTYNCIFVKLRICIRNRMSKNAAIQCCPAMPKSMIRLCVSGLSRMVRQTLGYRLTRMWPKAIFSC